jgi:hypothetical protein
MIATSVDISLVMMGVVSGLCLITMGMVWRLMRQRSAALTPFWATVQTKLVKVLHHPHPESEPLDYLLEQMEKLGGDMSPANRAELERLLSVKRDDPNESEGERERAKTLLTVMPLVVKEREDAINIGT